MKRTFKSSIFIPASPAAVFDVFTNYETYRSLPAVRNTRLVRAGESVDSYGIGAIRELDFGFAIFQEQSIDVNYPHYWDYQFIQWPLPLNHIGGRMSFNPVSGGTQMVWESTVEMTGYARIGLPFVAWLSGYGLKLVSLEMKKIVLKRIN